jgi:hypothetical protein
MAKRARQIKLFEFHRTFVTTGARVVFGSGFHIDLRQLEESSVVEDKLIMTKRKEKVNKNLRGTRPENL